MKELVMRVRIEKGTCLPHKPFIADSQGYTDRSEFIGEFNDASLHVSVKELQECIKGQVFDEDEDILVTYTTNEIIELLQHASIPFLWCNMPDTLRQMFATKTIIPISRKMNPLDQAFVVLQHLKNYQNKRAEWKQLLDKHLQVVMVPSLGCNLKTVVLQGTMDDVSKFVNEPIYQFEKAVIPKETYAAYLFASYSAFFDFERAAYWLKSVVDTHDLDLRYLEAIVHSIQHIVFFRTNATLLTQERSDLLLKIKRLEGEISELKKQSDTEIHELLDMIELLSRKKQGLSDGEAYSSRILEGRRIAVVGDDVRQPVYKMLLQQEGAIPIFIPGFEKISAGAERFSHVDGVIFITAYSSHSLYYALKARRSMKRTVLVHQCGVKSFQDGISQLRATFDGA